MLPIAPLDIPIPVNIPIVVPLESAAVPTHVPVTVEGAVGAGVDATGVGVLGVTVLPLHAVHPTAMATTIETCHIRI